MYWRSSRIKHQVKTATMVGALLLCGLVTKAQAQSGTNPMEIRFVTFNVNFSNSTAKIKADIQATMSHADVMMFQEVKWVDVSTLMNSNWQVYQVTNAGDARKGSAVAYRKARVSQLLNTGIFLGVAKEPGMDLLDRYINWMDIRLTNNQVIRAIGLHMPPQRYVELQTPMAQNLANFVNASPHPCIAGGDWNHTVNNDPRKIKNKTGLEPNGKGIDGFYYNPTVMTVTSITKLSGLNVNSDHDPVQMITQVYNLSTSVNDWALY